MIKKNEPYLIEYNVRMGDPECQVILPRLKSDILKIIIDSTNNELKKLRLLGKREKHDSSSLLKRLPWQL